MAVNLLSKGVQENLRARGYKGSCDVEYHAAGQATFTWTRHGKPPIELSLTFAGDEESCDRTIHAATNAFLAMLEE